MVAEDVEEYLDAAITGDSRAGVRVALGVLDRGSTYDDVIVNLLAAAQRESGRRWMTNACTVVDERDWHSLAGQMFAELLRGRGADTVFLGASMPAAHVAEFLSRHQAEALAVSCNMPLFFTGVASLVEAAHSHGIPVLAGGRGLGPGPRWASRLGADSWAAGIEDAAGVLGSWRLEPPAPAAPGVALDPGAARLEELAPELAEEAFTALEVSLPQLSTYDDAQRARTLEDLVYMVRFAAAARMVDDTRLFEDFLVRLRDLLSHRGVPGSAVRAGLLSLEPGASRVDPAAGRLLRAAADSLSGAAAVAEPGVESPSQLR